MPITTVLVLGKVMSSSPGFEIAISVTVAVVVLAEVVAVVVLVVPVTLEVAASSVLANQHDRDIARRGKKD